MPSKPLFATPDFWYRWRTTRRRHLGRSRSIARSQGPVLLDVFKTSHESAVRRNATAPRGEPSAASRRRVKSVTSHRRNPVCRLVRPPTGMTNHLVNECLACFFKRTDADSTCAGKRVSPDSRPTQSDALISICHGTSRKYLSVISQVPISPLLFRPKYREVRDAPWVYVVGGALVLVDQIGSIGDGSCGSTSRRSHTQRLETGRPGGAGAHEVRARDQSEDGQWAWPHRATHLTRPRR